MIQRARIIICSTPTLKLADDSTVFYMTTKLVMQNVDIAPAV